MDLETAHKIVMWILKIGAIPAVILVFLAWYLETKITERTKKYSATEGILKEKGYDHLITPIYEKDKSSSEFMQDPEYITVYMGNGRATLHRKGFLEGQSLTHLISFNGAPPFLVKIHDNKLLLTTTVYSPDGSVVAEIIDNEWRLNKNNFFKRNYDENAIEVIDNYNVVILQASYVNKSTIYISGIFFSQGQMLTLSQSKGIGISKIPDTKEEYRNQASIITPMFSYVGKDYLGKRIPK